MTINDQGDISDLDYQSQSQLINYLNKFGYKEVDNDFLSFNKFPIYDNQILDTETASLFPNISKTHLLAPYLLNENIKLKDGKVINGEYFEFLFDDIHDVDRYQVVYYFVWCVIVVVTGGDF